VAHLLVLWAIAAVALLVVSYAAAEPESGIVRPTTEPSTPTQQLGSQLYAGNCASCHGIGGGGIATPRPGAGGLPGAGPPLRGVGAEAADFYLRTGYMPLSAINDEPAAGRLLLSDTEIRSLVAYVASLGAGPAIPHPAPRGASIASGFQQFSMHCAGCHQIDGAGGFVTGARVPPLQGVPATQIAEAVRVGPYLMPRFPASQISAAQLNAIVKYVLSTRHLDNRGGWGIGNLGPIPEGLVAWLIAAPLLLAGCLTVARRART
jgi:ubiquinol-cytochrome c reductase cytochrome c subunit